MGLYYLCSDYKGVDQLRGYHAADLRLCFVHMQKADFFFYDATHMMFKAKSRMKGRSNVFKFSRVTNLVLWS